MDFFYMLLVDHLEFGWPIDYSLARLPVPTLVNHIPDTHRDVHISAFIQAEVDFNAMLGPFSELPFTPWFQLSPLMTRPKKDSTAKRVIMDARSQR